MAWEIVWQLKKCKLQTNELKCIAEHDSKLTTYLHKIHWFSNQHEQNEVWEQEGSATILISQVREPPNVADTH